MRLRRPRDLAALGALLLAAMLFAFSWYEERAAGGGGPAEEAAIERSYAASWRELDALAAAASRAVGTEVLAGADRGRLFGALGRLAAAPGARGATLLLYGPAGDLEAWAGPGLLQDPAPASLAAPLGFDQSVLTARTFATRPLAGAAGASWRLVVARSHDRNDEPPVADADRGRWSVPGWSLAAAAAAAAPPELRLEGTVRRLPSVDVALWRTAARGLLALALLVWAIGAWRRMQGGFSTRSIAAFAAAAGFAGSALGASSGDALALAAAVAATGGALWRAPALRFSRLAWIPGALAGPALLLWLRSASAGDFALTRALAATPAVAVARLAWSLALFALVALGAAGSRASSARGGRLWLPVAFAAALGAALALAHPPVAFAALALAGGAGALATRGRRLSATPPVLLLSALIAGAAIAAGEWSAAARAAAERTLALLPPQRAEMESFGDRIAQSLDAATARLELPAGSTAPPVDAAFALWRRSLLARGDAVSAVTLVAPGGVGVTFSSGLPLDSAGRVDDSPVRWVDRAPRAWIERGLEGERELRDSSGDVWRLRWALVPRPGFELGRQGESAEELLDTLRAEPARAAAARLPAPVRAVIYGSDGTPLSTPWLEGTPVLDPAWREGTRWSGRVDTPEGHAAVALASRDGIRAALFLLAPTPTAALVRAGRVAATLVLAALAAAVLAALLAGTPLERIARLRRSWSSYSRRLVVVLSALLLLPALALAALLSGALERRVVREQEAASLDALRSAQRVLGEYVLSLEPGFGIGTAIDDRLLEWLARVVGNEVHLYWGSEIYASSNRDLFAAGILPHRIPGEVWSRIALGGERVARRQVEGIEGEHETSSELYAPLEIPGVPRQAARLVLALPLLSRQADVAAETAQVRERALLATLAVALAAAAAGALLARRFTRPIQALVDGTRRIAEGAASLGFRPGEQELVLLAEAIDRMAARIAEARERLLDEKRLVERVVENVTAAVAALDRDGCVLLANQLARRWMGATPGAPLASDAIGERHPDLARALRLPASGEPVTVRLSGAGGERDWALVRVPLPGGGEPSELVVVEDVTDVARAQRLEAWAGMARIIAHEIKNPLTPIRLSAEHLREVWRRDREHFEPVLDRCLDNILVQVEDLRRTASEFSLYSEIPRIEPTSGDLVAAVAEVVEAYRAAPPAGVEILWQPPAGEIRTLFDRRLLSRAVRNLIENALRASASAGRVEIDVSRDEAVARIRVADAGPGVPAELIGRVLEPYFSTQSGGTGLGLPIARRVAEEHGGALSLRNRPQGDSK